MPVLQYSTFVNSLLTAVPELKGRYATSQDETGPDVLPHLIVGCVLKPFAKEALRSNADDILLERVFAFFEEMASSQDVEVVNLLYVGVFEAWVAEADTLSRAWKYMAENTKKIAREAAHSLRCGDNLPRRERMR